MKKKLSAYVTLVALISFLVSCQDNEMDWNRKKTTTPVVTAPEAATAAVVVPGSLTSLPKDVGGLHTPHVLGSNASPYGYYLYTPSGYTATGPKFPLLIFLHGNGEIGNSKLDPKALDKILVHGPPQLIKAHQWNPKYPMVVASVQCSDSWYDFAKIKKVTEFLIATYQVDPTRIYMTGLSMGGFATWDQIVQYGKNSHIAAFVPISGSVAISTWTTKTASTLPIWAFHGESDTTVPPVYDKQMHTAINALHPPIPEKLTMYAATGHDAWTKTYSGSGMGTGEAGYDAFNMDIYSWMFQFTLQ